MTVAIIALGSNLNNPIQQIQDAIKKIIALPQIHSLKLSSLYQTTPIGYVDQPDFINAVARIETHYSAPELLARLQEIEQLFGRERSFRNAPRTLDLDIIDYNNEIWYSHHLTLPHPQAHKRAFVIYPLAEIEPDYILSTHGTAQNIAKLLNHEGIKIIPI